MNTPSAFLGPTPLHTKSASTAFAPFDTQDEDHSVNSFDDVPNTTTPMIVEKLKPVDVSSSSWHPVPLEAVRSSCPTATTPGLGVGSGQSSFTPVDQVASLDNLSHKLSTIKGMCKTPVDPLALAMERRTPTMPNGAETNLPTPSGCLLEFRFFKPRVMTGMPLKAKGDLCTAMSEPLSLKHTDAKPKTKPVKKVTAAKHVLTSNKPIMRQVKQSMFVKRRPKQNWSRKVSMPGFTYKH